MIQLFFNEDRTTVNSIVQHDKEGSYIVFKDKKEIFDFIVKLYGLLVKKEDMQ